MTRHSVLLVCACVLPFVSTAASLTFDANPATAGAQDGGGTWTNGVATNWWDGVANTNWANATPDHATFGAGSGTAGTVVVAGGVTVAGITFNPAGSGTYILTNGTISLAGGAVFTNNTNATIRSMLGGSGFLKEGPGVLTLNPTGANSYAGTVTINAGVVAVQGSAGDGTIRGNVTINTGGVLRVLTADRIVNTSVITVNPGGIADFQLGDFVGFIAGEGLVTNTTGTGRTLSLDLAAGVTNVFGGAVGGGLTISVRGNNGNGLQVFTNANTFSGSATVTEGGLRITHGGALGTTGAVTTIAGTASAGRLELSGGITLAERLTLASRSSGATPNLNPHVINVAGTNFLAGVFSNATGGSIWNLRSDAGRLVVEGGLSIAGNATGTRIFRFGGAGEVEIRSIITNGAASTLELTKYGAGGLFLATNAEHNGTTSIENGTLVLSVTASLTNSVNIALSNAAVFDVSAQPGGFVLGASKMISGLGLVTGDVIAAAGAVVSPGLAGAAGALAFTNNLSLAAGTTSRFDFAESPLAGNDLLRVGGNFVADGEARLVPLGLLDTSSPYRLVDYSGTLAGNFATAVVANASYTATLDTNTAGQINVSFASTARDLVWAGGFTNWDLNVSAGWNTNVDFFLTGDRVTFDDSAPSNQTVSLTGPLIPLSVVVNGSSNYVLQGAGKISGASGITKDGAGSLTISTTNDFSGEVLVSNGVLVAGSATALGATSGATTVKSGGALDLNGKNLGGELVRVEGTGGGAGAIRNSGADQQNALRRLELTGDTTIDAAGRWEVRGDAGQTNAYVNGLYKLTKTGTNVFAFTEAVANVGDIVIEAGELSYAQNSTLNTGFAFTVNAGGIRLYQAAPFLRDLTFTGGGRIQLNDAALTCLVAGAVSTAGLLTNDVNVGEMLVLAGPVSGVGSLYNTNGGSFVLRASNSFAGGVFHAQGALLLGHDHALGSGPFSIRAGTIASEDATARVLANPVTVVSNFTLGQTAGGTGALTFNGGVDLGGTSRTLTLNVPVTFAAAISNGGFVKNNAGSLTLLAANTYDQGTTVNTGPLLLGSNATLGAGALLMSGGRIASDDTTARTITNALNIDAGSNFGDPVNTGVLTFTGPVDFQGGSRNAVIDSDTTWAGPQANGGLANKLGQATLRITANGDWTAGAALEIRNGTLVFDGCSVTNADALRVMNTNVAGVSRLVITNGAVLTTTNIASSLRLGYSPGGVVGATNIADISGTVRLLAGGSGGKIQIGTASARGILNLLGGGLIETRGIEHAANASEVHFDGGTVRFLGNTNGVMNGMTLVDLRAGGLTVDTAGFTVSSGVNIQDGGGGGITKIGAGTFRLGTSNSYEGVTTVTTGILIAVNSDSLGTTNGHTIVESGGSLALTNNITLLEPLTVAGEGNTANYGAIRNDGGTNRLDAPVTLTAQTRISIVSRELQFRGGIGGNFNVVLSPAATSSIVIITNTPITLGSNSIIFSHSPGQTRLDVGGNQFGELRVQYSNTFFIGLNDAVPTNATLTLGASAAAAAPHGFFDLNGWNQTIGVLTNGNGTNVSTRIIRNTAAATLSTLTIGSGNESSTFDGSINDDAGVLALTKIGTGTQILFGTHGYNGGTVINAGTLLANGAFNGTGDVLVAIGATLGGTGTIAGAVANAGTVSPGNSSGLLIVGSFTQTTNGALALELEGTNFDQLVTTGTAALDGALNVTLINGYTGTVGDTYTLIAAGALTGTFATTNLPVLGGGNTWTLDYTPNTVVLSITNATPPPPTGYTAFSNLHLLALGETGDDDLDGYANLYEYVTGSNPTNSGSNSALASARTNGLFALKFLRDTNTIDATLIIEGSYATTNDADWIGFATNIAGSWGSATNVIEDANNPANVTAFDIAPAATNRYLRLRITRP